MTLPDRVFAQASPISIGGISMFARTKRLRTGNVVAFASMPVTLTRAIERLFRAGFEILQVTPYTINVAGTPDQFEKAFETTLVSRELPVSSHACATHIDCPDDPAMLGLITTEETPFADVLEGVALEVPRYYHAPTATPPPAGYW